VLQTIVTEYNNDILRRKNLLDLRICIPRFCWCRNSFCQDVMWVSDFQRHDAIAASISQKIGIFRNIALIAPKPATIFFF